MKRKTFKIVSIVSLVLISFLVIFPNVKAYSVTGEAYMLSQLRVRVWWWYQWTDRTQMRLRITANRQYDYVFGGYYLENPQFYFYSGDLNGNDDYSVKIRGFETDGQEYPIGNNRWFEVTLSVDVSIKSNSNPDNYERFIFSMTLDYNEDVTYDLDPLGGDLPGTWRHLTSESNPSSYNFQTISHDTLDWGVDEINAERVWGGTENSHTGVYGNPAGDGVKVLIIDSGIDTDHPDLQDNYVQGYDFLNDNNNPEDTNGHGTHCAGIVAAIDNYEGIIGVAPEVNLYIASYGGDEEVEDLDGMLAYIEAIQWGIDHNVDIISMSNGISALSLNFIECQYGLTKNKLKTDFETKINAAYNAGIIIFAAAGNADEDISEPEDHRYPACYSNVVTVGALNNQRERAHFSNYGSPIDIMAPGVNIYSTCTGMKDPDQDGYQSLTGTSMACPMVAGVAALLLSAFPSLKDNPNAIKTALYQTAVDLNTTGWDQYTGWGMVDAVAAVDYYS